MAKLEELVYDRRFVKDNSILLLLYAPLGLLLVTIRIITGIFAWLCSALLVSEVSFIKTLISNITCFTLGIYINKYGERDEKTRLIIGNTVSMFDSLPLHVSTRSISPSKWDLPHPLAWALGVRNLGVQTTNEQFREAVRKKFADVPNVPIFIQPEGCPTSGRGVLKFSVWPFTIYDKVQPVAIEVHRVFGKVTTGSLSYWDKHNLAWTDLFWFLWNPYTTFNIHILPVMEKAENETTEEFANRTQKAIADFLKVEATEYTSNELRELVASREAERMRTLVDTMSEHLSSASPSLSPDLQRMAAQIKEILPTVPLTVITKDLGKTRNIDITLTNILEGSVPFTPEMCDTSTKEASTAGPSQVPSQPQPLRTAAASFPRNAHDRQLSYQERKAQLIEAARRRYIEKHNLKNC